MKSYSSGLQFNLYPSKHFWKIPKIAKNQHCFQKLSKPAVLEYTLNKESQLERDCSTDIKPQWFILVKNALMTKYHRSYEQSLIATVVQGRYSWPCFRERFHTVITTVSPVEARKVPAVCLHLRTLSEVSQGNTIQTEGNKAQLKESALIHSDSRGWVGFLLTSSGIFKQ